MIVDTSALVAILRDEPEAAACALAIEIATERRMSAASFLEVAIVIDSSRDAMASRRLDELIQTASITVEPVTAEQALIGRAA